MISRVVTTVLAIAVLVSAAQARSQPIAFGADNQPTIAAVMAKLNAPLASAALDYRPAPAHL